MNLFFRNKIWLFFLLAGGNVSFSNAQLPNTLKFSYYSLSEGLGSTNIRKIIQDTNGYTWIATQDGLYKFDGLRFTAYNRSSTDKYALSGSDIRDLFIKQNTLWLVSSFGGIDAIDLVTGNVKYRFNQQQFHNLQDVLFLSIANNGDSLLIGSDHGLYIFNTQLHIISKFFLQTAHTKKNPLSYKIDKVLSDNRGRLWLFFPDNGVSLLDKKSLQVLDHFTNQNSRYYDCDTLADGVVAGTNNGLLTLKYQLGKIVSDDTLQHLFRTWQNKDVYAVKNDNKGHIWFSITNQLFRLHINSRTMASFHNQDPSKDKGWLSSVYNIYFDISNNLWLSCQEGVVFSSNRLSEFRVYHKSAEHETSIKHAYHLFPNTDSTTIVSASDGLYKVNLFSKNISPLDLNNTYYYSFEDRYHNLIISGTEGTYLMKNGKKIPLAREHIEFRTIGKLIINSSVDFGDSLLVLGTQNKKGILLWNYKKRTIRQIHEDSPGVNLKDNNINTLFKDGNEKVWILGDNCISILHIPAKRITEIDIRKPGTANRYTIFFDMQKINDQYYISSYSNGIIVLDKQYHFLKEINTGNGLCNNGVYKLLRYKDSLLLATSNNGISTITIPHNTINSYYQKDGLQSSVFEELSGNSRNNLLYVGGVDGFTLVDPSLFSRNPSPPSVLISSIEIETPNYKIDTTNLLANSFSIPNTVTQVIVKFSGINYTNPGNTVFAYRIANAGKQWINIGHKNELQLIGLKPGDYQLEIKAANEDGVWSSPKQLQLLFLPKWYQTTAVKALLIFIFAGLLYLLYRYRIRQILKLEEVRQKIGSDLHDDIGSTLHSINLFTKMTLEQPDKKEYLQQIKIGVDNAISSVRDIIWILDTNPETVESIFNRIHAIAEPLVQSSGCRLQLLIEASVAQYALAAREKRNIYLVIKESINNCIKYAQADLLTLNAHKEKNRLNITISDNGKGFTLQEQPSKKKGLKKGYGLENIRLRCEEIKWVVSIQSTIGLGTTIHLYKKIRFKE